MVFAGPCWKPANIVLRSVIKWFFIEQFFFPFFLFSFFSHFLIFVLFTYMNITFHILGFWFSIMIFLIWKKKRYQLCEFLERYACSMSQTKVKELKPRKNMNVTPKSLSNEFQIQVCWKGKDSNFLSWSFDLRRKMVPIVWDLGKASHEGLAFLHSWFGHSSISQWLEMLHLWQCRWRRIETFPQNIKNLENSHLANFAKTT